LVHYQQHYLHLLQLCNYPVCQSKHLQLHRELLFWTRISWIDSSIATLSDSGKIGSTSVFLFVHDIKTKKMANNEGKNKNRVGSVSSLSGNWSGFTDFKGFVFSDLDEIVIDSLLHYKNIFRFLKPYSFPRGKIKFYRGKIPLFESEGVEKEIEKLLGKRVRLKSGGSIIIEETEALVSIDVNSGKRVRGKLYPRCYTCFFWHSKRTKPLLLFLKGSGLQNKLICLVIFYNYIK